MQNLKRRLLLAALLLVVTTVGWAGVASAAYLPEGDRTISITIPVDAFPLNEQTAQESFERHEAIHARITKQTGKEIDHSYIWIEVNGTRVLAADPPRPMFGDSFQ